MKPKLKDWWNLCDNSLKMNLLRGLGWVNPGRMGAVVNMTYEELLEALSTSEQETVKAFYKDATLTVLANLAHEKPDLAKYS